MQFKLMAALFAGALVAGCATAEQTAAREAATQQRLAAVKAEAGEEKVSLNASLEEYGKMTLLDDETGEEKIICKYQRVTGSRFGKKTCATPREWEQLRRDSRENTEETQRNMDARCPGGGVC